MTIRVAAQPLSDEQVSAFVARMRATKTVPDVSDQALLELARASTRRHFTKGELLFNSGEAPECVYLIASGVVDQITTAHGGSEHCVIRATEGYGIGDVPTLSGGLHLTTTRAMSDEAMVDCMPIDAYSAFLNRHPGALARILGVTRRRNFWVLVGKALARVLQGGAPYELAPLLNAFEPVTLTRGQPLFKIGDKADGWYVVITGRLRVSLIDAEGRDKTLVETGAGEALGDLAILTGAPREVTAIAARDTTVARVKPEIFLQWIEQYPTLMRACFTSLTRRAHAMAMGAALDKRRGSRVFAIVRGSEGAPLNAFGSGLAAGFKKLGNTLHVKPKTLEEKFIVPDVKLTRPEHPGWLRAAAWIEDSLATHPFIVLETDQHSSVWEGLALRLADTVVAVGGAKEKAIAGVPFEKGPIDALAPQRFLAIVQADDAGAASGAEEWVKALPEYRPLHVRLRKDADFDRVARTLANRAVTVALGGGGARGLAHIGVLRAFHELGIPVDVIGGTSMGSIIAAQYAMGMTPPEMIELNKRLAATNPFGDFTIPMFALLRTRRIEAMAREAFGDRTIESLWLPYLAVSANLTSAELVLHERGPVWEATRASGALPGIAQPLILGGETLIDGGVLNNLPGDVLRDRFGGIVVAVNVSPKEEKQFAMKEEFPSPWAAAMRLLGAAPVEAPTILDIMTRAVTLTSARRARFVEREADYYLAPPIDGFGMLEFERIDEIVEVGYRHAMETLKPKRSELP